MMVEVDIQSSGLPGWNMVGLLETAVKEARDRVGSAIRNAGFSLPSRRTIINLSPADVKKSGSHFDLPIAIGLLCAVGACPPDQAEKYLIAGELSLRGNVLPVSGVLLMSLMAKQRGLQAVIVPMENAWEGEAAGIAVIAVENLSQVVDFLSGREIPARKSRHVIEREKPDDLNLSEVRGQPVAKRALEIAAAGAHNIALRGPPGTGKTMLAERLPSILPPLSAKEALELAKILSWHGMLKDASDIPHVRPFRAPHHSASYAGLIGGASGHAMRLGEISLAHHGVLFLDELGEFRRDVIESLRGPLESGIVRIVRAGVSLTYPARIVCAAAFNPCPCGFLGHSTRGCSCTLQALRHYRSRLSGPFMDRIDLHIGVDPPPHEALTSSDDEERSEIVLERVMRARARQQKRYGKEEICNAHIPGKEILSAGLLSEGAMRCLRSAPTAQKLSGRALHRVVKIARTIAALAESHHIHDEHLTEALSFRASMED